MSNRKKFCLEVNERVGIHAGWDEYGPCQLNMSEPNRLVRSEIINKTFMFNDTGYSVVMPRKNYVCLFENRYIIQQDSVLCKKFKI